jgi:hypothetical protein
VKKLEFAADSLSKISSRCGAQIIKGVLLAAGFSRDQFLDQILVNAEIAEVTY